MTKELIFIASTNIFIVAFTYIILWFAWDAVVAWRAEKGKTKRIEAAIDETEYFTPDWEAEIHRVNRTHADGMKKAHETHNKTVARLQHIRADGLLDLRERRSKEEKPKLKNDYVVVAEEKPSLFTADDFNRIRDYFEEDEGGEDVKQ